MITPWPAASACSASVTLLAAANAMPSSEALLCWDTNGAGTLFAVPATTYALSPFGELRKPCRAEWLATGENEHTVRAHARAHCLLCSVRLWSVSRPSVLSPGTAPPRVPCTAHGSPAPMGTKAKPSALVGACMLIFSSKSIKYTAWLSVDQLCTFSHVPVSSSTVSDVQGPALNVT